MLKIYPAIDVIGEDCVRLTKGHFDNIKIYDKAINIAKRYKSQGFEWLHIVDLEGSREGQSKILPLVLEIKKTVDMKVQLGGGFKEISAVKMGLDQGINRILLSGLSYKSPSEVKEVIKNYGKDRIGFCWDGKKRDQNLIFYQKGWTEQTGMTLDELYEVYRDCFPEVIFMTNIDRDGTLAGVDREFYSFIQSRFPDLPVGVSGGIQNINDVEKSKEIFKSFIVGKALLEGLVTSEELLQC